MLDGVANANPGFGGHQSSAQSFCAIAHPIQARPNSYWPAASMTGLRSILARVSKSLIKVS
jgi:hypothetical protein